MNQNYKNSYKVTEKELVSLSVYNVGFQKCDPLYQWGPGIRDHYLIHYIISGKGYYKIKNTTFTLQAGDSFLVYPNTEVLYFADETDPWEYAWVGFTGSDASMILKATDFSTERPVIEHTPLGGSIHRQILHIYDARGNEFEHAVEMTGRLYTMLALFMHGATTNTTQNSANSYVQKGIEYISSNYSYHITVEDISAYVGLSRSQLFRSFESVLGQFNQKDMVIPIKIVSFVIELNYSNTMYGKMKDFLSQTLAEIKEAGLYKEERLIESAQQAAITVKGKEVLNFCANNYLGLSNHPRLIKASQEMMNRRGYGMSSVRFICGTQDIHKELEAAISDYFQTEDTILYAACFDANGGVFEPLFSDQDAIISDSLNHASIIDGVRLCKAKRYRYANADMNELEKCLQEAQAQRFRIIVTDGVFSMDGNVAPMDQICDLAEKYDALVIVDESHSAGVVGATGHGVSELYKTHGRVDIYTGTLGKAFGGALGGFTTGRKEIIDLLRQRSRPYLFSNSLAANFHHPVCYHPN